MKYIILLLAFGIVLVAAEKSVRRQDLPPAVQKTVVEQSKGATILGYARETEDGKTFYEASMKFNGRTRDVSIDPSGKVVLVEEEIAFDAVPLPVKAAIDKQAGKSTVRLVEVVTDDHGKVTYEAHIRKGIRTSEYKFLPDGSTVK